MKVEITCACCYYPMLCCKASSLENNIVAFANCHGVNNLTTADVKLGVHSLTTDMQHF